MAASYVAVCEDGYEHFFDVAEKDMRYDGNASFSVLKKEQECQTALRKSTVRTSYHHPVSSPVTLYRIDLVKGQASRKAVKTFRIMPQSVRLTDAEFGEEMKSILSKLPEEFRSYVSSSSWDRGHSAGYEEVIGIAREEAQNLAKCLEDYDENREKFSHLADRL